MTVYKHGAFQFESAEVNMTTFESIPRFSERGQRMSRLYRIHCSGEVQRTSQADITTRIGEIRDAMNLDFVDSGLFLDNGTVTPHFLQNAHIDNMTGVRVAYRSWPRGGPGEYANKREFRFIVEAEFAEAFSQILEYQERFYYRGNAGPWVTWHKQRTGLAQPYTNFQFTTQTLIQTGKVMGLRGYPDPPTYIPPPVAGGAFEHQHLRRINPIAGTWRGNMFTHYGWEWTYVHEFPTTQSYLPSAL